MLCFYTCDKKISTVKSFKKKSQLHFKIRKYMCVPILVWYYKPNTLFVFALVLKKFARLIFFITEAKISSHRIFVLLSYQISLKLLFHDSALSVWSNSNMFCNSKSFVLGFTTSFEYGMDNVVSSMGWQGDIKHSIDDFHDRKWKISWYLFWHTSMDVLSVSCSLQNVCRYIPS